MVRNIFVYLLILLVTLYIGILNRQSWAIMLFFAEIILFFLEAVAVFYQRAHLNLEIKLPESVILGNEQARAEIILENTGYMPVQRMEIRAEYQYIIRGNGTGAAWKKRKKIKIWGVVDSQDTQNYELAAGPFFCGQFLFSIPYVKIYDYFGIFSLKIKLKKKRIIMILPSIVDMQVLLSGQEGFADGQSDSAKKGEDGTEVYDIREYQSGDTLRQIYWKRSAGREELLYRERVAQRGAGAVLFLKLPEDLKGILFHYQLKVAGSFSYSLFREGFLHFLVWENPVNGILERKFIETEQNIYEAIIELLENSVVLTKEKSWKRVWKDWTEKRTEKKKVKKSRKKDAAGEGKNRRKSGTKKYAKGKEPLEEVWQEEIQYQYQMQFAGEVCPKAFFLFYGKTYLAKPETDHKEERKRNRKFCRKPDCLQKAIILKKEMEIIGEFLKGKHLVGGKQEEEQLEKELQENTF